MGHKIKLETALRRYQVQVKEVHALHKKSVSGNFPDSVYTDYITCQGTQPGRLSGEGHKKCGARVPIQYAFKCLYCSFWFCLSCGEIHFGKTREQHNLKMEGSK